MADRAGVVEGLLEEYRSLRQESLEAIASRNEFLVWGSRKVELAGRADLPVQTTSRLFIVSLVLIAALSGFGSGSRPKSRADPRARTELPLQVPGRANRP